MRKNKPKIIFYNILKYTLLIGFTLLIVLPLLWTVMSSFKEPYQFYNSPFDLPNSLYFINYQRAIELGHISDSFLNSVIVTGLALIFLVIIAVPCSYVLTRYEFKGKKTLNLIIMAGLFINVNYLVVPIFLMLIGAQSTVSSILGVNTQGLFIDNKLVLSIVYASTALPFSIYILNGYFKSISSTYEEAAEIDGCSYSQTLVHVMLPLVKPGILIIILFNFLSFWNEYIMSLTLMPSGVATGGSTLPVGIYNLNNVSRVAKDFGAIYAGLVLIMIPTIILYLFVQKQLTEGMTMGGLKE